MSTILKSVVGKLLGLDKDGYLTNPTGIKVPLILRGPSDSEVNDLAVESTATVSSTGTAIGFNGYTEMTSTAAKTYSMSDPTFVGVRKTLHQTSTTTAGLKVGFAAASIDGTNLFVTLSGRNSAVSLIAKSTLRWGLQGDAGTVAFTTV